MDIVVTPSEKVYRHKDKKIQITLLEENIRKKLASKDISVSTEIEKDEIIFQVDESQVAATVHYLEYLPGAGSISPCMRVKSFPEGLRSKFEEQNIEAREYQLSVIPDNEKLVEDIIDVLGDEGWKRTENPDVNLTVRSLDNQYLISLHSSRGTGGLPTDTDKVVVVPFRNRADAYASFIYLKKGFSVHPLTIRKNTDDLKEGLRFLEEYAPETKPLVAKSKTWKKGAEKAVEILKPEKIITGRLEGEEKLFEPSEFDIPVEEPLKDMEENDVLQMYENIRPVII